MTGNVVPLFGKRPVPLSPRDQFALARRTMLGAFRELIASGTGREDLLDEVATTASVMRSLVELEVGNV